jgi:hypothetical protein
VRPLLHSDRWSSSGRRRAWGDSATNSPPPAGRTPPAAGEQVVRAGHSDHDSCERLRRAAQSGHSNRAGRDPDQGSGEAI